MTGYAETGGSRLLGDLGAPTRLPQMRFKVFNNFSVLAGIWGRSLKGGRGYGAARRSDRASGVFTAAKSKGRDLRCAQDDRLTGSRMKGMR